MTTTQNILTLPQTRAADSLSRIFEAYESGNYSYESDLLEKLTEEFARLYEGIRDPLITPEQMKVGDLLRLSAITRPMEQLDTDLSTCYEQLALLKKSVLSTANISAVERTGLEQLLSEAKDRLTEAVAWSSTSNKSLLWASDTFKTTSKVDSTATTAFVDTKLGVVTLEVTGQIPLSDRVSRVAFGHVKSDSKYADGIPGNWLELASTSAGSTCTEVKEPIAPTFNHQLKDTSNPASMFDGNPDTWFEWEKYLVPEEQELISRGTAWVVPDGTSGEKKKIFGTDGVTLDYGWEHTIHWPGENQQTDASHWIVTPDSYNGSADNIDPAKSLIMTLDVEFDDPQELSWIELLPYLPHEDYELTSAKVSGDGISGWKDLISTPITLKPNIDQPLDSQNLGIPVKDYKGTAVVTCGLPEVKALHMEFKQAKPSDTVIGHKYHIKSTKVTKKKKHLFSSSTNSWVEKTRVPSDTDEGLVTQGKTGFLMWGTTTTREDAGVNTFYDYFKAYRYAIGIRDLGLFTRAYAKSSTFITRPIYFTKPVSAASLVVSQHIPDAWDNSHDWITYEISSDRANWQRVTPLSPGSATDAVAQFPATTKLYLRITLTRPDDSPNESPVIDYYAVEAVPEDTL